MKSITKSNISVFEEKPEGFARYDYTPGEKERLLAYLEAYEPDTAGGELTDCVTGKSLRQPITGHGDGEYYWSSSDIYHIRKYDAAVTKSFLEKVMSRPHMRQVLARESNGGTTYSPEEKRRLLSYLKLFSAYAAVITSEAHSSRNPAENIVNFAYTDGQYMWTTADILRMEEDDAAVEKGFLQKVLTHNPVGLAMVNRLSAPKKGNLEIRTYSSEKKRQLLGYMRAHPPYAVVGSFSDWVTGEDLEGMVNYAYTDGRFLWTEADIYHLEKYNAAVKESFLEAVSSK